MVVLKALKGGAAAIFISATCIFAQMPSTRSGALSDAEKSLLFAKLERAGVTVTEGVPLIVTAPGSPKPKIEPEARAEIVQPALEPGVVSDLQRVPNLRSIHLGDKREKRRSPDLAWLQQFPRLSLLSVSGRSFDSSFLVHARKCTALRVLAFNSMRIRSRDLRALKGMPELCNLWFYDCELDGEVLKTLDAINFQGAVSIEYRGDARREAEFLEKNEHRLKFRVDSFCPMDKEPTENAPKGAARKDGCNATSASGALGGNDDDPFDDWALPARKAKAGKKQSGSRNAGGDKPAAKPKQPDVQE